MKLRVLVPGRWTITSPIKGDSRKCHVEIFLDEIGANYSSNVEGLLSMMDQHAQHGAESFNTKQCHYVDQEAKIYEYRKGRLRLFWFEDAGRVIICTHGIVKKTQKTPGKEVSKAKRIQREYFEAKAISGIEIEEEE